MVSSKLTVDDFFFSFSSDCKKENFPIQIFFFTFGLRYLEDRSGVEIATKMFAVSTLAKKIVDDIFFLLFSAQTQKDPCVASVNDGVGTKTCILGSRSS